VVLVRFSVSKLSTIDATLGELVNLESLQLSGRLSSPGLPSLQMLSKLKELGFTGVQLQPEAMGLL
jgi:hypothetical protein